jgi:hypothetical protein
VAGRGVGGVKLCCVGDHILQEFNTLYLTRFRTYKIARLPQTKTVEGKGPQTDIHRSKVPIQVNFILMTTFCIAFNQSNLSTNRIKITVPDKSSSPPLPAPSTPSVRGEAWGRKLYHVIFANTNPDLKRIEAPLPPLPPTPSPLYLLSACSTYPTCGQAIHSCLWQCFLSCALPWPYTVCVRIVFFLPAAVEAFKQGAAKRFDMRWATTKVIPCDFVRSGSVVWNENTERAFICRSTYSTYFIERTAVPWKALEV